MPYEKIQFNPQAAPGISADRLNHMQTQYEEAAADLSEHELEVDPHPQYARDEDLMSHLAENASEAVKGHVELATAAETTAGTDNTRAVHPAALKVELDKKVNKAGDSMTGDLTFVNDVSPLTKGIKFGDGTGWRQPFRLNNGTVIASLRDDGQLFKGTDTNTPYWHAGNDGVGSWLDADLLDGFQSTDFARGNKKYTVDELQNNTTLSAGIITNNGDGLKNSNGSVFKLGWWHVINMHHIDDNGHNAQIAVPLNNNAECVYYRNSIGGAWTSWRKLWGDLDLRINNGALQFYDGGVWKDVGGARGPVTTEYALSTNSTSFVTLVDITGKSGAIKALRLYRTAGSGYLAKFKLTLDNVLIINNESITNEIRPNSSTPLNSDIQSSIDGQVNWNFEFKTSCKVEFASGDAAYTFMAKAYIEIS
ncbi:MAG: pyocin knob domain-containing protein [Firmicutes bacterium]|nr:pyocin knob domain-containing protein [Bacillota bacterium]